VGLVLRRIRWPRSLLTTAASIPATMLSRWPRLLAVLLQRWALCLVLEKGWWSGSGIWRYSPATVAGFAGFGSRSAWGMSPADSPQRQVPVLQAWSSVHNALKAMALAWILVCWFSIAFSGVHLGGAGGRRQFQIGLFTGTPKDLLVILFYFRVFSQSFLDTCQSWFFCMFHLMYSVYLI
jgi:hypothetical protein